MKTKHLIKFGWQPWMLAAVVVLSAGCTEQEDPVENTGKYIVINYTDTVIDVEPRPNTTRGTKVTTGGISSLGVCASVYPVGNSYTSAGCGSYFYKESVTPGTPTRFYWPTSDYKLSFFGYYPYNNAAFTVQSAASATGAPTYAYTVPSAIASQLDVMTGQNVNITGGGTAAVNMTMKHRCASICFSVTNSRSSAITLSSVSIEGVKYSGTLNEETWTLASAVNSSSSNPFTLSYGSSIAAGATANVTGTTNIFMMLPQTLPATAKVKVVVAGEDPLYADITGSWVAGRQYNYSLNVKNNTLVVVDEETEIEDWEPHIIIDLSMVDNTGNARASRTTANCYLIHKKGEYMLPLVYGNAIKNGEVNTVAFNPGGSTTYSYCANFINHNNDAITGPWITKNGSGVNAGMNLTAASAELLWQDASGLISAVGVDGDYLTFTVGTFAGGNALIAVKDGSGTILWSWHIWATDDDLSNTTVVATGSHDYTVASVNLGWVPTGGDGKQGYCPYYQWGRKDPFVPCDGVSNGNTDKTVYDISGTTVTGLIYQASKTATIADNIKNPTYFYYNSSTYGPVTTSYYNMWDAQNTTTDNVTTATKKTIYDPCPPGFCVPTGNLYRYMGNGGSRSMSTWNSTNKGASWNTNITGTALWLPAAGYRYGNSGALRSVRTYGNYWSATPNSTVYGRCLNLNSSNWYWGNTNRAYGDAVRPVAE